VTGPGSTWAVVEETEESLSPCIMKSPSPLLDVAEALVTGGLATTVTKLCIVRVEVDSVSRRLLDTPV
jgi:hypothetical protein